MQMDLTTCVEFDEVADDIIAKLQNNFKITNIYIDDENIIRAKIEIQGINDLQQLGYLLDEDIVLGGPNMDMVTDKYTLGELGW